MRIFPWHSRFSASARRKSIRALALYEEAVGLGLRASDLLEENIETQQSVEEADEGSDEPSGDALAQETGAPVSA